MADKEDLKELATKLKRNIAALPDNQETSTDDIDPSEVAADSSAQALPDASPAISAAAADPHGLQPADLPVPSAAVLAANSQPVELKDSDNINPYTAEQIAAQGDPHALDKGASVETSATQAQGNAEPSLFDRISNQTKNQDAKQGLEDSDENDEDDEDDSPKAALVKKMIKAGMKSSAMSASTAKPTDVNDVLSKILGGQNDALVAAQQAANMNNLFANLNKAGNQIGGALSWTKPNNEVADGLLQQANKPVTDVLQQSQLKGESLKQADLTSKLKTDMEKDDANSAISNQYRSAVEQFTGKSVDPNMSAASLDKLSPIYEKMWQTRENNLNRQALSASRNSDKADQHQNQALQQVSQMMAGARTSPDYKQAKMDMYNSAKANDLINMYGDPNKLSPGQAALVAIEIAKIAKGGTPDKEEFSILNPSTLQSKFAGWAQKLTNNPTPANAGAFLKQYQDYLGKINDTANQVVSQQYNTLLNPNRKRLGEDNFKALRQEADNDLVKYNPKSKKDSSHPQDDDAVAWAKANPNDPRAAQILKINGAQ